VLNRRKPLRLRLDRPMVSLRPLKTHTAWPTNK